MKRIRKQGRTEEEKQKILGKKLKGKNTKERKRTTKGWEIEEKKSINKTRKNGEKKRRETEKK